MLPTKEQFNEAFGLTSAFIWEGSARIYYTEIPLEFRINSNSECEHDGDYDALLTQAHDLEGEQAEIDGNKYQVTRVICTPGPKEFKQEGEFSISLKGLVTIKKL